jgi:hypothetical protein
MRSRQTLKDFQASKSGRPIGELLSRQETIGTMEALSREGRPAVLALDQALPRDIKLDDTEKKHVGRWIRDVLADRGWRPRKRKGFRSGRVFSSGAVYGPVAATAPELPAPVADQAARIRRAQAMVRRFSTNDYGVNDFLRDKRAEAARER